MFSSLYDSCNVDAKPGTTRTQVPCRRCTSRIRRGQSLVEFAIVALVIYMLLAAILTFGHALFVAQGLQTAAEVGAREISRTPLPASMTFEEALSDDDVRERIFDEAWLVIDLDDFFANFAPPSGEQANIFRHLVPTMPLLNQQLATMLIVDHRDTNGDGTPDRRFLRYPGALLDRAPGTISAPNGGSYPSWVETNFSVSIPIVTNRDADGVETLQWVAVVEEIEPVDSSDIRHDPFRLDNSVTRGIVALRINFPFQSASMSSFELNTDAPLEPTIGRPNIANEADSVTHGTYAGANGLGVQQAFGRRVRPYRRVISAQAIFRREVFE